MPEEIRDNILSELIETLEYNATLIQSSIRRMEMPGWRLRLRGRFTSQMIGKGKSEG